MRKQLCKKGCIRSIVPKTEARGSANLSDKEIDRDEENALTVPLRLKRKADHVLIYSSDACSVFNL